MLTFAITLVMCLIEDEDGKSDEVAASTISNESAGTQGELNAGTSTQKEEISQECIVGDEAVHKELGDRMEMAATTASSLEAEQDSVDKKKEIITETNIRSDLHLEDAGGTDCLPTATIFEELERMGRKQRKKTEVPQDETHHDDSVPIPSNDPPLSGEDRMQLTELMILCTNLQKQVLDLEKAKDAQAKEIAGRSDDAEMFDTDDLHGDEVIVDMAVGEKQEQSAKVDEIEVSTGVEDSAADAMHNGDRGSLRYIDTRPNGDALYGVHSQGPYTPKIAQHQLFLQQMILHHSSRNVGMPSKGYNKPLIAKYFKKIYKPTNNNLRTSSNTRNKNVDTTPRYKNDNQTGQFGNQRAVNVVGARETVGGQVVQQSGIQCFNCKEFGHYAKECRKPKRVKDSTYHKEKMLLCKQAEKVVQLQAEQSD
ncbi:ribonuclease H-like domain-containing protein [Tanacetum coccineum]|uniref:Ribonuclease H-like domain-containing protein n=1 Tax=Tanacetum coccineum TaxID=301880 RepID=A0ABQ5AN81_9ASTR